MSGPGGGPGGTGLYGASFPDRVTVGEGGGESTKPGTGGIPVPFQNNLNGTSLPLQQQSIDQRNLSINAANAGTGSEDEGSGDGARGESTKTGDGHCASSLQNPLNGGIPPIHEQPIGQRNLSMNQNNTVSLPLGSASNSDEREGSSHAGYLLLSSATNGEMEGSAMTGLDHSSKRNKTPAAIPLYTTVKEDQELRAQLLGYARNEPMGSEMPTGPAWRRYRDGKKGDADLLVMLSSKTNEWSIREEFRHQFDPNVDQPQLRFIVKKSESHASIVNEDLRSFPVSKTERDKVIANELRGEQVCEAKITAAIHQLTSSASLSKKETDAIIAFSLKQVEEGENRGIRILGMERCHKALTIPASKDTELRKFIDEERPWIFVISHLSGTLPELNLFYLERFRSASRMACPAYGVPLGGKKKREDEDKMPWVYMLKESQTLQLEPYMRKPPKVGDKEFYASFQPYMKFPSLKIYRDVFSASILFDVQTTSMLDGQQYSNTRFHNCDIIEIDVSGNRAILDVVFNRPVNVACPKITQKSFLTIRVNGVHAESNLPLPVPAHGSPTLPPIPELMKFPATGCHSFKGKGDFQLMVEFTNATQRHFVAGESLEISITRPTDDTTAIRKLEALEFMSRHAGVDTTQYDIQTAVLGRQQPAKRFSSFYDENLISQEDKTTFELFEQRLSLNEQQEKAIAQTIKGDQVITGQLTSPGCGKTFVCGVIATEANFFRESVIAVAPSNNTTNQLHQECVKSRKLLLSLPGMEDRQDTITVIRFPTLSEIFCQLSTKQDQSKDDSQFAYHFVQLMKEDSAESSMKPWKREAATEWIERYNRIQDGRAFLDNDDQDMKKRVEFRRVFDDNWRRVIDEKQGTVTVVSTISNAALLRPRSQKSRHFNLSITDDAGLCDEADQCIVLSFWCEKNHLAGDDKQVAPSVLGRGHNTRYLQRDMSMFKRLRYLNFEMVVLVDKWKRS